MICLYSYKGLALLKNNSSETIKTKIYCLINDIPVKIYNDDQFIDYGYVPIGGTVEWCQKQLGYNVIPDYYPTWLQKYISRNIWYSESINFTIHVFIKPSDTYKRFNGVIVINSVNYNPPFVCSNVVKFVDEFRYYITHGEVVSSDWYIGEEKQTVAPILCFDYIPTDFCGAIDIGILDNDKFELVEVHHPFACGWYGDNIETYIQWCIDGWEYLKRN